MNQSNDSERLAKKWLEREYGASNVRRNNNDPPDFEVDVEGRKVGVEVRRLDDTATKRSKTVRERSETVGEEEVFRPVTDKVMKAIKEVNKEWDKKDRRRFYVMIGGINRNENAPLWDEDFSEIVQFLQDAVAACKSGTSVVYYQSNDAGLEEPMLTVCLGGDAPQGTLPGEESEEDNGHGPGLWLGVLPSGDEAAWVVPNLTKHISRCMEDKTQKVSKKVDSYDEWWLVLNDRIVYGHISPDDQHSVKQSTKKIEPWKRIIILNGVNDGVWEV